MFKRRVWWFLNVLQFSSIYHWIRRLLLVCYNLKSLKFSRQFIDYVQRYPDIKQKKHRSKKVSCTFDFLQFGQKLAQIFTSISSQNWFTILSKFDVKIFFSCQSIKVFFHFYHLFFATIKFFFIYITYFSIPFLNNLIFIYFII